MNEWHNRNEEKRTNLFNRFRKIRLDEDSGVDQKVSIQQMMNDIWIEMNGSTIDHDEMIEYYEQFLQPLEHELNEMNYGHPDESDALELEDMFNNRYQITCMLCCRAILVFGHQQESTIIKCSNCGFTLISRLTFSEEQLFDRIDDLLNQHDYGSNTAEKYYRCIEKIKFSPIAAETDNSCQNIQLKCNVSVIILILKYIKDYYYCYFFLFTSIFSLAILMHYCYDDQHYPNQR